MADAYLEERYTKLLEKHNTLVSELRAKVECPVCLVLPIEGPMASCPKGHLVCLPCHQAMVSRDQGNCPNCREPMGKTKSLLAKTVIENIEHECNNDGCNKMLPQRELVRHERELCDYRKVLCPELGCNQMILHKEVVKHKKEICEYREVFCPEQGCKQKVAQKELAKHMEEICEYRKVRCSKSTRCNYRNHIIVSELGCNQMVLHKELIKHKEEFCQDRRVLCPGNSMNCNANLAFWACYFHFFDCKSLVILKPGIGCTMVEMDKTLLDGEEAKFETKIFTLGDEIFAVQTKMNNNKLSFGVLMMAQRAKCERWKVTIEVQDNNSDTVFLAQFNPDPVDMKNSGGAKLVVEKATFAKMVTSDGQQFRYKLKIKVSEKRGGS